MKPVLIVHGGAGDITDSRVAGKISGIKKALKLGYELLAREGNALDAVEKAVCSMELNDNFNAGYGSVLNIEGNVEMEASIMHGKHLRAGCCTLIKDIMHPISLARRIMEKTNHTFLGGESAMNFAWSEQFEVLVPGFLVTENAKLALKEFIEKQQKGLDTTYARTELGKDETGTVGAVAIDTYGNIAVATSTGGITGKVAGRIGDTPLLGCGTYADNEVGGVSTTGHGETIMRYNLAQRILDMMRYQGVTPQKATESIVEGMTKRLIGTGGAITVDKYGEVGIHFSSKRMAWAYIKNNELHFGINPGEHVIETL